MSAAGQTIELTRDCTAVTVPYGERVELTAGGTLRIVQQLGASITVQTPMGTLLRIEGADADALGLEPLSPEQAGGGRAGEFDMAHVLDALDTVYDPEIPISIVELGLVYRCEEVRTDDGRRRIEIDMTMTAPGCGMGDVLRSDAEGVVSAVPGVDEVEVNLVWQPRWTIDRISEAARLELGLL